MRAFDLGSLVGLALAAPAQAAGPGDYSPSDWWPLRGSNLVGCAHNSPGPICGGDYHPFWAIDVQAGEGPGGSWSGLPAMR